MYYIKEQSPFEIRWHINIVNSSVSLADAKLLLVLKTVRGNYDVTDYIEDIVDNVIRVKLASLTFVGDYSLYLKIQSDSFEEVSLLERFAFRVVKGNDPSVIVDVVELSSDIYVKSYAYDSALSSGSTNAVQNAVLTEALADKQETINDLEDIRSGASKGATALQDVPEEYITDTELALLLNNKVDKEEGKGLSTNDYTTAEKNKLASLKNYDDSELLTKLTQLDNAKASKEDVEELVEELEINAALIEGLQNTKIDKEADDYYPQLSVGLADNLAGEDEVDSEISFRRSGGGAISDGAARIESIKGNSVVWNQLARSPLFDDSEESWSYSKDFVSATLLDNGEIYAKGKGVRELGSDTISPRVPLVSGHAYLYRFDIKKNISEAIGVYLGDVWNNPTMGKPIDADIWYHVENISVPTENLERGLWIYPWNNTTLTDCEAWIKNVVVYDLTKMFGAGNEPSTIEEFNARKPLGIDESAYNEGEVIHMDVQSLESVGVNQWDEQWESGTIAGSDGVLVNDATKIRASNLIRVFPNKEYHFTQPSQLPIRVFWYGADKAYKAYEYFAESTSVLIPSDVYYIKVVFEYATYNNDICINLSDASVNGKYFPYVKRTEDLSIIRKYFPNGMKSAGTAHDEIRYNKATQKWEKVQRIGSVDMGSLSWYTNVGIGNLASTTTWKARMLPLHTNKNGLCKVYPFSKLWVAELNTISFTIDGDNYYIGVTDPSYENVASFKSAMQGVILYYELAEPIVTELEDDFNLDYEVWNGGTERIVSDVPTTPLKAEIAYGFNAVGKIKELEEKINSGSGGVSKDYVDGKLTELSAEVSGLSERVDDLEQGGQGGKEEVFWAKYGKIDEGATTYEEIVAAHNEGKLVLCYYDNTWVARLEKVQTSQVMLQAYAENSVIKLICNNKGQWTMASYSTEHGLKTLDNGNAEITIAGKTAEVATPQYVENAIQQSGGGGGASSDKQGVVSQTLNYNSDDNTYSVSNVVRGAIPSFFIDLVTEAGASFNAESGYFSLNGIDNIAYDEMRTIYDCRTGYGTNSLLAAYGNAYTARTNFVAFRGYGNSYANHEPTTIYTKYLCDKNASITKFALCSEVALYVRAGSGNNFESLGLGGSPLVRSRLEEIIGIICVSNLTGSNNFFYNGAWHPWLTAFRLKALKASIDLSGMPRLSEATILYMINNEKAASAITIKLHADAKAMADASEAIQSALAAHTNITLGV